MKPSLIPLISIIKETAIIAKNKFLLKKSLAKTAPNIAITTIAIGLSKLIIVKNVFIIFDFVRGYIPALLIILVFVQS